MRFLKNFSVYLIALVFLLDSCQTFLPEKEESYFAIPCQAKLRSAGFTASVSQIAMDTGDFKLRIQVSFKNTDRLVFPIDKQFHDTLSATAFKLEFFCNGKAVALDRAVVFPIENFRNRNYYYGKEISSALCFATDTIDLKTSSGFEVTIPFYVFQQLKRGKQNLEMKISQRTFCSASERSIRYKDKAFKDSSTYYKKFYADKPLLSASLLFALNVPAIYKTVLYGEGLKLRNDSTFSPAGMDNTIWKSSYPDIYWTLVFPNRMFYGKTPYEESTDHYSGKDTFNLYHYRISDTIAIGVYDHDNLSQDDWLGDWRGSLYSLHSEQAKMLRFGHVAWFAIKAKNTGIVNN